MHVNDIKYYQMTYNVIEKEGVQLHLPLRCVVQFWCQEPPFDFSKKNKSVVIGKIDRKNIFPVGKRGQMNKMTYRGFGGKNLLWDCLVIIPSIKQINSAWPIKHHNAIRDWVGKPKTKWDDQFRNKEDDSLAMGGRLVEKLVDNWTETIRVMDVTLQTWEVWLCLQLRTKKHTIKLYIDTVIKKENCICQDG